MSSASSAAARFSCTPAGAIAAGRRRLARLLITLALLTIGAALASWISGRLVPGLLALGVVFVIVTAWRMSGELQPRWLELQAGSLTIQTRRQPVEIAIDGAKIRTLDERESRHLARLVSAGGFVAGAGGFDSHILGEFDLYATNLDNALLIEASGSRLLLTPDQPEDFVTSFRQMAAAAPATIHSS